MVGASFSPYRIMEELGEGDMGIIYRAQDMNCDRLWDYPPLHELMMPKERWFLSVSPHYT